MEVALEMEEFLYVCGNGHLYKLKEELFGLEIFLAYSVSHVVRLDFIDCVFIMIFIIYYI